MHASVMPHFEKGIQTVSLPAHVLVLKYADCLLLCGQLSIFESAGFAIADPTLVQ